MSRILQNRENVITQEFGNGHSGIDIVGTGHTADSITAHSNGTVIFCQKGYKNNKGAKGNASYGNCVKIQHTNGYCTLYAHLYSVNVNLGQIVKQGQVIGYMGNTGNSYGTHLHFEVWKNGSRINPKPYINSNFNTINKTDVIYQVYSCGQWLSNITNYNNSNGNGYAGLYGKPITGFRGHINNGQLQYRVHIKNGNWLDLVVNRNKDTNGDDYAGILGKEIDAIMMKSTIGQAKYRVHILNGEWLPWVNGYSQGDNNNGYAGNFGKAIDAIQIEIV